MPGELYFFYHVYGSSLQLEALGGNGWAPVWSAAWQGGQDHKWALARVTIPPDSGLLRFVGNSTGGSYGGYYDGVALDGIGLEAPHVGLSCDFESNFCFWLNTGNSAWQRVASQAEGSWFLEASTNVSVDQTFTLESARFNATSGKGLLLKYQLGGSSSISLQSQLEGGTWRSIFLRTGDNGSSWHTEIVRLPEGTLALRIVGNVTAAEDVVRVDRVELLHTASGSDDLACSFEDGFCSWSNSEKQSWQRRSGYTYLGPQGAFDGTWYLRGASGEVRFLRVPCCRVVCQKCSHS